VFSNAPAHYAHAVLEILGMAALFDAVYTIEHTRFRPKPDPAGFRALLAAERAVPERTVMVDDSLGNLRAARRLGLATVWVSRQPRAPRCVDARIGSVRELPRLAARLGIAR
jgi:putative hydrolase of the HAD superfamily